MTAVVQPFKRVERKLAGSAALWTDAETSARMGRIRQRETEPEILVRRICRSLGLHYRTRNRDLPGSPDLANRSHHWAIFVHGCYWHRHAGCPKTSTPRRNAEFWNAKFATNVERDRTALVQLRKHGYRVLTIWQCEAESVKKLGSRLRQFARMLTLLSQTKNEGVSVETDYPANDSRATNLGREQR